MNTALKLTLNSFAEKTIRIGPYDRLLTSFKLSSFPLHSLEPVEFPHFAGITLLINKNGLYNILFYIYKILWYLANCFSTCDRLTFFFSLLFVPVTSFGFPAPLFWGERKQGTEFMKVTPHLNHKYAIIQKGKQLRKNKSFFNVLELVLKSTDVLYAYEFFD